MKITISICSANVNQKRDKIQIQKFRLESGVEKMKKNLDFDGFLKII